MLTLRQIIVVIQKTEERNKPAYINFIDFKKAFDCIHRDTLWDIVRFHGILRKVIYIIRSLYEGVHVQSGLMAPLATGFTFQIYSGVRQGNP